MVHASLLLREAREADIPAVTAIYDDAVLTGTASYEIDPPGEAEMAKRWRALTGDGFPYLVAEAGGAVLGYAYAGPFRTRPAYRYLVEDAIYVSREAQRGGVGRALLTRLVSICEDIGFRQIVAVIGDGGVNVASVGVHEACGFHLVGRMEASGFKHGRWLDTVLMQRALGPGASIPPEAGRSLR